MVDDQRQGQVAIPAVILPRRNHPNHLINNRRRREAIHHRAHRSRRLDRAVIRRVRRKRPLSRRLRRRHAATIRAADQEADPALLRSFLISYGTHGSQE